MSQPKKKDAQVEGPEQTLEGRLRRLEEILTQLEADEVDLERALGLFEEGVTLVRDAERVLAQAELRVQELLSRDSTVPFEEKDA